MKYFYFKPNESNRKSEVVALGLAFAYIIMAVMLLWMFIAWSYDVRALRGLAVLSLVVLVLARFNRLAQSEEN